MPASTDYLSILRTISSNASAAAAHLTRPLLRQRGRWGLSLLPWQRNTRAQVATASGAASVEDTSTQQLLILLRHLTTGIHSLANCTNLTIYPPTRRPTLITLIRMITECQQQVVRLNRTQVARDLTVAKTVPFLIAS